MILRLVVVVELWLDVSGVLAIGRVSVAQKAIARLCHQMHDAGF